MGSDAMKQINAMAAGRKSDAATIAPRGRSRTATGIGKPEQITAALTLPASPAPFDYNNLPEAQSENLRKQAVRIRERTKATTAAIIEIGRDLLAIKQTLEHGQFIKWIEIECLCSIRAAQNYMRAAEFSEGKSASVAYLPPATIYKLAARNTPPEIITAVMGRLGAGGVVLGADVDAALAIARQQRRDARTLKLREDSRTRRSIDARRETAVEQDARIEKLRTEQARHIEEADRAAVRLVKLIGEEETARLVAIIRVDLFAFKAALERQSTGASVEGRA